MLLVCLVSSLFTKNARDCSCMLIKQLMLAGFHGKMPVWGRAVERKKHSAKRPSCSLSGKRKLLRFARTGTPLDLHSFSALDNNCYFKCALHV